MDTWKVVNEVDQFNSADNDLRIIDASPESLTHPQGPVTLATVNVRAFAPHVEHAEKIAQLMAAAPELLDALQTWNEFWDTMPKGQMGKLSFDVGLLNDGFIKMGKAIARATGNQ